MWPGRAYWRWNFGICLALSLAFAVLTLSDGLNHGAGDVYFLLLLLEAWVLASVAVWLVLLVGSAVVRAGRRLG